MKRLASFRRHRSRSSAGGGDGDERAEAGDELPYNRNDKDPEQRGGGREAEPTGAAAPAGLSSTSGGQPAALVHHRRSSSSNNNSSSAKTGSHQRLKEGAPVASKGSKNIIVLMMFLCTFVAYMERQGFSIAFTEMARVSDLSEATKGGILSAFFYGYAFMQVPGGWLSAKYGGYRVLCVSFSSWSIISFITPSSAAPGALPLLRLCRVLVGLSQGVFIPATHTVLANWLSAEERSRLVSLAMSGMYLGSGMALLCVPSIVHYLGVFAHLKVVAFMGFLWLLMWMRLGANSPHSSGSSSTSTSTSSSSSSSSISSSGNGGGGIVSAGGAGKGSGGGSGGSGPLAAGRGRFGTDHGEGAGPSAAAGDSGGAAVGDTAAGGAQGGGGLALATVESGLVKGNPGGGGGGGGGGGSGSSSGGGGGPAAGTAGAGAGGRVGGGRASSALWFQLLNSSAVMSLMVTNFAFHYATYVLMNWLPTYFRKLHSVNLVTIGSLNVLPHLAMFVSSNMGGWLSDYMIRGKGMSVKKGRVFVTSTGFCGAGVCLLLLAWASRWEAGLVWASACNSFLGLSRGGWAVNHLDIAPKQAGLVIAIANGAGTCAGVVGVSLTGLLLDRYGGAETPQAWTSALGVVAFVLASSSGVFAVFSKGRPIL